MAEVVLEFVSQDKNGDKDKISCSPSTVHVKARETVTWKFVDKTKDLPFMIYFDGVTPFRKAHIEGEREATEKVKGAEEHSVLATASIPVRSTAQPGMYKYIVAADYDGMVTQDGEKKKARKVVIACPCVCCEC